MSTPLSITRGLVAWCDPEKDPVDGCEVRALNLMPAAQLAAAEWALALYEDARPSPTARAFHHDELSLAPDQEIVVVDCAEGRIRLHFPGVMPRQMTVLSVLHYWIREGAFMLNAGFAARLQQQAQAQQMVQRLLVPGNGTQ